MEPPDMKTICPTMSCEKCTFAGDVDTNSNVVDISLGEKSETNNNVEGSVTPLGMKRKKCHTEEAQINLSSSELPLAENACMERKIYVEHNVDNTILSDEEKRQQREDFKERIEDLAATGDHKCDSGNVLSKKRSSLEVEKEYEQNVTADSILPHKKRCSKLTDQDIDISFECCNISLGKKSADPQLANNSSSDDIHDIVEDDTGSNEEIVNTQKRIKRFKEYEDKGKILIYLSKDNSESLQNKGTCSSDLILQSNGSVEEISPSCEDANHAERLHRATLNDEKDFAGKSSVEIYLSTLEDETCKESIYVDPSGMKFETGNLELLAGEVDSGPSNTTDGDFHCAHTIVPLKRVGCPKRKLLILDVNGLLADIVSYAAEGYTPDTWISMKAVFKRPFCDDFLKFCFERFDLGIWSSRTRKNVDMVIGFLMGDMRHKLLFCWNQYHCTETGYMTLENKKKPLVLKEIQKLWNKEGDDLPWEKGDYDGSNSLLLDDSPYKGLCNPPYSTIFPYPYEYKDVRDNILGPGGRLRVYLEKLLLVDNVQNFVKENPFGQRPISQSNLNWPFYSKIITDGLIRAEKKLWNELIKARLVHNVVINLSSRQEERKNEESACSLASSNSSRVNCYGMKY